MDFTGLVKRISPKLKGITYRLRGYSAFFSAEDLYQEAIVRLWQDFNAGKLADKTDSYILQGAYFNLKNYIRKNMDKVNFISLVSQNDEEDNHLEKLLFQAQGSTAYLDILHNKLLADTMLNNGLTKREKEVLSLYAHGLTTRDIGKKMGISHVMVVKMTDKIREKCKRYLDN